jgi:hypothetical protein
MIFLSIRIGSLGITVVGEANSDFALKEKLCVVNASERGVGSNLDMSVSSRPEIRREKGYRESSSNTTGVCIPRHVGDHERTGGSFVSGECSVDESSITEILDVRRGGVDMHGLYAVAQIGKFRVITDCTISGLKRVRSSLRDRGGNKRAYASMCYWVACKARLSSAIGEAEAIVGS